MLKLSAFTMVTILLTTFFIVSIAATTYYHYGIPHARRLRILYTHSDQIVDKVVTDFEDWYNLENGEPIQVTVIYTDLQTAFEKATTRHRRAEADLWWGGPLTLLEKAYGTLLPYNSTLKDVINSTCHSCPLMDPEGNTPRWYAASLIGLGVMYNQHRLEEVGLPIPQTWMSLNNTKYAGNITMTEPTRSDFTLPFTMLMLQNKGWTNGWAYLVKLSAIVKGYENIDYYSALKISNDYLPLAVVPDSFAYERMAMNIPQINFTYLDATILQPDPIAIIKKGMYVDEAKAFIDYILTKGAQNMIGNHRLPIRPDVTPSPPRINPFTSPKIADYNLTLQEIIKDYYRAWITERHNLITHAWEKIEKANKTGPYFHLAWKNFTYAGHYTDLTQIQLIYRETEGWTRTENVTSYKDKWLNASKEAYNQAIKILENQDT